MIALPSSHVARAVSGGGGNVLLEDLCMHGVQTYLVLLFMYIYMAELNVHCFSLEPA